ncbi:MAG: hypothetical protein C0608_07570 [Deltaproteobacteria bacterium]|nr:MAG: hypothetical protein C0608_07570 [Deltaproteobacteria bacterium]
MRKYTVLLFSLLMFQQVAFADGQPWPEGLEAAARTHIASLQQVEDATKSSPISDPRGIVPMSAFERETHFCHETKGQVYRVFLEPAYIGPREDGQEVVNVSFEVYFRQGIPMEELYKQEFKRGTDTIMELRYRLEDGAWSPSGKRELIDLSSPMGGQHGAGE